MSTLALIQSRICRYLSSGSSLWKNSNKLLQAVSELDSDLESWKIGLPSEFQPTALTGVANAGIVQLQFAYYAATWEIQKARRKIQDLPLTPTRQELLSLVLNSPTPTHSARAIIDLLQRLSPKPFASLW